MPLFVLSKNDKIMIEFTGHVQVTLFSQASNVIQGEGVYDFMADAFEFSPVASDDDGGVLYNCEKTFVIDKPDGDTLRKFSIQRSCMVSLFSNDGTSYIIGTSSIPARALISLHLNRAHLQIFCKMLKNPLG